MKKFKKIDTREVKKCFVISQLVRFSNGKKFLLNISENDFENKLLNVKKKVLNLSDEDLDKLVSGKYKKRLVAYNNADWYLGEFDINEAGVWRRAGGLPLSWTRESLKETSEIVKLAMNENSKLFKNRPKQVIPNILKINALSIQNEKYLLPITFIGGTGTKGRRMLRFKTKLDIDDGCMRSIALAINGQKRIKAYIGFPKD